MRHKRSLYLSILIVFLALASCRVSRMAERSAPVNGSADEYINTYSSLAVSEMKRTGIPASITLAQGIIESGMGKGRLAVEANNHFGIKCHDDWTGPTIRHNDDRRNECFRKYRNPEESFRDHSDFLVNQNRYRSLFDLDPEDYKGWARGLKRAGYATNPDYANMLIHKIEEYGLHRYDVASARVDVRPEKPNSTDVVAVNSNSEIFSGNDSPKEKTEISFNSAGVMENNRIQYVIVREGDTRESLEKEHKLLRWELPRYNELPDDFIPEPGQLLYLQPKRSRAEPGKEQHVATEGQTMYQISQIYGIKLEQLYILNRMEQGSEPVAGQKIYLRKIKPVVSNQF
jgi:LysM repeat protein